MKASALLKLLLLATLLPTILFGNEESTAITPPSLIYSPAAIMPNNTGIRRLENPKAEVKLKISAEGDVIDAICIAADHYNMSDKAERLAKKYTFTPASQNGSPIPITNNVIIHFTYESRKSNDLDGFSNMQKLFSNRPDPETVLELTSPRKLDSPPQVLSRPEPILVKNEEGTVQTGKAIVEGYIDWKGNFRFLNINEADNQYIAEAALKSFSTLTFAPPTIDGRKTVTKIRLPFIAH